MLNIELEDLVIDLAELVNSKYFGKYRGIVKNVEDPKKIGRITAEVPEIYEDKESPWASPSSPIAGPSYGFCMLPKEGDGVWIEFEGGDISRPIWTGFWWSEDELPELVGSKERIIISPNGHKISLNDENDEIHFVHKSGSEIKISEDEILLKVGSSQIVLSKSEVNINEGALVVK
jgi:hypothetical protein